MLKVNVNVTQEDIDNGGTNDTNCPVALASNRVMGGEYVRVGIEYMLVGSDREYPLPRWVGRWIKRYDKYKRKFFPPCNGFFIGRPRPKIRWYHRVPKPISFEMEI